MVISVGDCLSVRYGHMQKDFVMERRDKFQAVLRQQAASQLENIGAGGFRQLRMRSETCDSVSKSRRYGKVDRPGFIANWIFKIA
jgi:hypothetical protein